jgi:hypothetical protein
LSQTGVSGSPVIMPKRSEQCSRLKLPDEKKNDTALYTPESKAIFSISVPQDLWSKYSMLSVYIVVYKL